MPEPSSHPAPAPFFETDGRLHREVEHGRYLMEHGAGEVWNWEGAAGQRRWARRVRMLTADLGPNQRVLELGCGTGYFTERLAETGAEITAIDISPELLEAARERCRGHANVRFIRENAYALSFAAESFEAVIGSSVLHHLEVARALSEVHRVLIPAGRLRFTEPNMMNPQIALQKNIPALKRRLGDSPDETAFFRWSLADQLRAAGFRDPRIACFDFVHPRTPPSWIGLVEGLGHLAERTPLVREIAGSLWIQAVK